MLILDANVILRYLLGDIPDMAEEARRAVIAGASTTIEVLAEVVYVLAGVYKADRKDIATTLDSFLLEITIPHKAALGYALRLYGSSRLYFVDCILAGYKHIDGTDVLTFDKKLQKVLLENSPQ